MQREATVGCGRRQDGSKDERGDFYILFNIKCQYLADRIVYKRLPYPN